MFRCLSLFIMQNFATFLELYASKTSTKRIKFTMSKCTKTNVRQCENKRCFRIGVFNPTEVGGKDSMI
jgi:hypothetical protein